MPPLRVLFAGCKEAGPGPSCTLTPNERSLTVWVDVPTASAVRVSIDGERIEGEGEGKPEPAQGGWRWTIDVPSVAHRLEVEATSGHEPERFVLPLETREFPVSEALSVIRRMADKDPAGARERLAQTKGQWRGLERVRALHFEGILAFNAGDRAEFQAAYSHGVEQAERSEQWTWASRMAQTLAYDCINHREFDCARAWLDRDIQLQPFVTPNHHYYRGLMLDYRGDLDDAMSSFRQALDDMRALGAEPMTQMAVHGQAAVSMARLGKYDEVVRLVREGLAIAENEQIAADQRVNFLDTAAWSLLLSRTDARLIPSDSPGSPGSPDPDPSVLLHRAVDLLGDEPTSPAWSTVRLNLAYAALQRSDGTTARQWLEQVEPERLIRTDELWRRLLWARAERAEGTPERARRRLRAMLGDAERYEDHRLRWAARVEHAHVLEDLGRDSEALGEYVAAERVLEQQLPLLGLGDRARFMSNRDAATRHQVALLLRRGEAEGALCVARRARTRVLRALHQRLRRGAASDRGPLDEYLETHLRLDQEHDQTFMEADAARASQWRREIQRQREGSRRRFETLMQGEGGHRPELLDCTSLSPPPSGSLDLHFVRLDDGWVGFSMDEHGEVTTRSLGDLGLARAEAPLGAAREQELSTALLTPFAEAIEAVERLRVMPSGSLYRVPLHALPFGAPGRVLHDAVIVVYGLDLPDRDPPAAPSGGALVLAPPSNLPRVREEARLSLAALRQRGGPVQQLGDSSEPDAVLLSEDVLRALPKSAWFHYVGHARSNGIGGWDSELVLAADGTMALGVSDVLALRAVPGAVVLSGCETGVTDPQSLGGGMSLAHAFMLAGSSVVVATTREIRDDEATELMRDFYAALEETTAGAVPSAMRRAQQQARARSAGAVPSGDAVWRLVRTWVP